MRLIALTLTIVLILVGCTSGHGQERMETRSFRETNPHVATWENIGQAPSDMNLRITFALKQRNIDELESNLLDISEPTSTRYGEFYSREKIRDLIYPGNDATESVISFLEKYDIPSEKRRASFYGDYIDATISVATLQTMFQTKLQIYKHKSGAQVVRPLDKYLVPFIVAQYTDFIRGLEFLPTEAQAYLMSGKEFHTTLIRAKPNRSNLPIINPEFIRTKYNIPPDFNSSRRDNSIAFASFLGEKYNEADLVNFLQANRITVDTLPATQDKCKAAAGHGTGEASLDVQIIVGLSRSNNVVALCYEGLRNNSENESNANQEPFLDLMREVNEMPAPPNVISISYGDDECAIPRVYAQRVNRQFMISGLLGITIVASSGDNGVVGSVLAPQCQYYVPCNEYQASFPASSPYVVSVGGSAFTKDSSIERVATIQIGGFITSGGGFSAIFSQPTYQKRAVDRYLEQIPVNDKFNNVGRGYPDVSAESLNFPVFQNPFGTPQYDGTSASAPLIASILSLMNEYRLAQGKRHLGFANPLLYSLQNARVYNDITTGDNSCGGNGQPCCTPGFPALPGWDAATGLGSIDFSAVIKNI